MQKQTCPRRFEAFAYGYGIENEDTWQVRDGRKYCSYCGSLNSADFLNLAEHTRVIPTDKDYKAYIGNDKFYFQHLDREQQQRFIEVINIQDLYVLPYFVQVVNDDIGIK